jgi:ubiquinone/menaquinone biosynthesis C-methylase UbiE
MAIDNRIDSHAGSRIDNRSYYDEFASSYERYRHAGYHVFLDELETATVRRYLRPEMHILEAGCGTGLVLNRLAPHAARSYGVDLSRGMVKKAHERQLTVVQGSVTDLPFADASFDLVCSFKVLAHVQQIERAMAEMARVLRPGGILLAEFYNRRSLRYLIKRLKPPTRISQAAPDFNDEAVFTRYDTLRTITDYLPPGMSVENVHGVRVLTPLPIFHRLPLVAPLLQAAERLAADLPGLRHLGGFLIVAARKTQ